MEKRVSVAGFNDQGSPGPSKAHFGHGGISAAAPVLAEEDMPVLKHSVQLEHGQIRR